MLKKVVAFVKEHLKYDDEKLILNVIEKHREYGTIDCGFNKDGSVRYVVRWNIDGDVAHILDFAVEKKWRSIRMLKYVLLKNLARFPYVKFISFERDVKYPGRKQKMYAIKDIVKEL